ncbi:DUF3152 domain-containing protein [Dactylosporangium matsuzakiense]|uniref:Lipoprotein n=1 Tax=Dactylosporangium matsuzakiense TaxID=53360 RepID=A0A9W6KGQ7_9ACTN|nr:DUF3152 domain-containing protein [Dactylosporangium matsuzakiense]GLK99945.1 lipoprotein [Dactylosporangium matsuzakiense]
MNVLRIAGAGLAVLALAACSAPATESAPLEASPAPPPAVEKTSRGPVNVAVPEIGYPKEGGGQYEIAAAGGPVIGTAGQLLTYRIALERDITGLSAAGFAEAVEAVFADPRSWPGTGKWRLRRAGSGERFDFTIYLATPATRDKLCVSSYDRYTSCRNGNSVVINVARWVHGVPDYGADLVTYRQYVVNHETGHRLFHGHELCPGPGRPAPVMEQQTLGLHGCTANAWPIVDGREYSGPSGQYNDPARSDP